jgi:hypothetical protein
MDQAEFGPNCRPPFHHIALNVDAASPRPSWNADRAAGIEPPASYVLEHGYCRSVYITDPNGMIVEFTCDEPTRRTQDATPIAPRRMPSSSGGSQGITPPTMISARILEGAPDRSRVARCLR